MRKNERFKLAMEQSGLVGQVEADFKGWGVFHIDNADVVTAVAGTPDECALLAVTWMNETTFRFYSEPNTNNVPDDNNHWDVGPMQLNVGIIRANIANKFLNADGLDVDAALVSTVEMFIGDPMQNVYLGYRLLKRIGRGTITGPNDTILYTKLTVEEWDKANENYRNERRAVAYTGPLARPARYASWVKYAPLFQRFFQLYADV